MKLEKREISLNEADSFRDTCAVEKMLLYAYVDALCKATRQETKKEILRLMQETGEDLCFAYSLLRSVGEKNGKENEKEE